MKLLREATVRVASLHLPGNWRKDLDEDLVSDLAAEMQAGRLIPPIRLNEKRELVQGRHSMAAALLIEKRELRADIVRYDSDLEQQIDVIAENLRRRVLDAERRERDLGRLFELTVKMLGAPPAPNGKSRTAADTVSAVPRQKADATTRKEAIEQAAATAGVSPRTVERAVAKAKPSPAPRPPKEEAPAIDLRTFGLGVPAPLATAIPPVQALIDQADRHMRSALAVLTKLKAIPEMDFPGPVANRLHEDVQRAAQMVRGARPAAICPWCKAQPTISCVACEDRGYVTQSALNGVPWELLAQGDDAMVSVKGNLVPLAQWKERNRDR